MLLTSTKIAMCVTSISEPSVAERQETSTAGWNWTLRGKAEIVMSSERSVVSKKLQERQRHVFILPNNSLTDGLGSHAAPEKPKPKKPHTSCRQSELGFGKAMKPMPLDSGIYILEECPLWHAMLHFHEPSWHRQIGTLSISVALLKYAQHPMPIIYLCSAPISGLLQKAARNNTYQKEWAYGRQQQPRGHLWFLSLSSAPHQKKKERKKSNLKM